ncbi:putative ammonium transporter 1 isoform X1 [Gigantopelta aegis]|uniref:putative ammonium transporter 1 isoform X1 n=1 Tax=Gigantopelta aegis TaxID=1735272 RepID=UPI001B88BDAB|nr:putative ammonium transporter 1 isoform X1 [Gigantopelta aegis]
MANVTAVDSIVFKDLKNNLDQFFLIIMGMIVFLMQCGFGFLEAGAVRSKNTTNILLKNFCDSFVAGISYWLVGYPFAFGEGNSFLGYTNFASYGFPEERFAFFFFQFVFAATAATIVSGAMAERCEIIAYFTYSIVLTAELRLATFKLRAADVAVCHRHYRVERQTGNVYHLEFVSGIISELTLQIVESLSAFKKEIRPILNLPGFMYPIVTHWAWHEDGWLTVGKEYEQTDGNVTTYFTAHYSDFAGSGVVHILGGVAAFVGALLLGPRQGRFHKPSSTIIDIRGHSVPLAALGGFILLFGFLAFNGGSQLNISESGSGQVVALAVVNTFLSGSCSAFVTLFSARITGRHWSLLFTINGALAGMVAACAGCNVIYPWGACIVGVFASISYQFWAWLMVKMWIDDPLDAVAVHFGGGFWGVISVAFLHRDTGIIFAWDKRSGLNLAWQFVGAVSIATWTAVMSLTMFGVLKLIGRLRVPREIEEKGLDIPKHGEPSYPWESYGHGWTEKSFQLSKTGELHELKHVGSNPSFQQDDEESVTNENHILS